jgi:hypothetical protein
MPQNPPPAINPSFPLLDVHPSGPDGGLSIPWSEHVGRSGFAVSDASLGADGVVMGMVIWVYWDDLATACQQILGYSWRDLAPGFPRLKRKLPLQNPYWTQLWATRLVKVQGVQPTGKVDDFAQAGPVASYNYAIVTIQFTRPKYSILADADVPVWIGPTEAPNQFQEWERFTDRHWSPSVQMLSREGQQFRFAEGPASPGGRYGGGDGIAFAGSVGTKVPRLKLQRRWYQIPEKAIYDVNGFPTAMMYTQTPIVAAGPTALPLLGTVNNDEIFGPNAAQGCLLLEGVEIIPQPLQLPPFLMMLPGGLTKDAEEHILQYDIVFHMELFDPYLDDGCTTRGHNCMPFWATNRWALVKSVVDSQAHPPTLSQTPFFYSNFADLFQII